MKGISISPCPAIRHGLGVFQMVVDGRTVLLYAGRTERDVQRYITMDGNWSVFKFNGDILYSNRSNADFFVCSATPSQVEVWTKAFLAAVLSGSAHESDPAAFALVP